ARTAGQLLPDAREVVAQPVVDLDEPLAPRRGAVVRGGHASSPAHPPGGRQWSRATLSGMARTEDPRTAPPIRWGILGAGRIAATFAQAVNAHTRAQLVAVGSRNRDRSERFATAHGIPTTHHGYRGLVEEPHVDAIYIATPHSEHKEHALLAISAGKHVLVEKAFTRNA